MNLSFRELVADGPQLGPSKKALSLVGKRVRLIGFMVDMELPSKGGFFLTGMPVKLDESGGGIGDLPLANIFVISRFADGKEIPHRKGPLEMTGIFDVGYRADEDGRVSWFRLNLDGPMETQVSDNLPGEAPSVAPGERKKDGP